MPYVQHWIDNPKDLSLPVLPEKPQDGKEYHHCHYCKGWIPGYANTYEENTMSPMHPLSGRQGTVFACRRCGEEIDFLGMVS